MAKIALIGATISGNKGAASMLQSVLQNVPSRIKDAEFSLLSLYPREDLRENRNPNLEIVSCKPIQLIVKAMPLSIIYLLFKKIGLIRKFAEKDKIIKIIKESDILIDLSGISFVDGRGIVLIYDIACVLIPICVGTKVIKYSQAMGPFKTKLNRFFAKLLLPKIHKIGARGHLTSEHLKEIGLDNFEICADAAFSMNITQRAQDRADDLFKGLDVRNKVVGISPSSVVEDYCEQHQIEYNKIMAKFIDYLIEKKFSPIIIPHAAKRNSSSKRNNDLVTCKVIHDLVKEKDSCVFSDEIYSAEELRAIIGKVALFISSRFHSMISSLTTNVPTLLIGWSHKYYEVLEMFELGKFAIDYKDLSFEKLVENFEILQDDVPHIKQKIQTHLPDVINSSLRNVDMVAEVFQQHRKLSLIGKESKVGTKYEAYIGSSDRCYLTCARDDTIRDGAASGGFVSTLLIYLLENKYIDGALVSRIVTKNNKLDYETFIARTREDILSSRTSIYFDFPLTKHFKSLISEKGKFAVVSLPCQLYALKNLSVKYPEISKKIAFKIGLFCGHTSSKSLIRKVLERKKIDEAEIQKFIFRKGHWRGQTHVLLKDGKEIVFPFMDYSLYQNLYFCMPKRCLSCEDHCAELSDISCGDAWLKELKKDPIKYSIVISRKEGTSKIINEMIEKGTLIGQRLSPRNIFRSQKRAIIFHKKSIAAREKLGKLFGFQIRYTGTYKARWNDYLSSLFILLNVKLSYNPYFHKIIFKLPRPLLFFYVLVIKFMINF